jgi:hypothetical protein
VVSVFSCCCIIACEQIISAFLGDAPALLSDCSLATSTSDGNDCTQNAEYREMRREACLLYAVSEMNYMSMKQSSHGLLESKMEWLFFIQERCRATVYAKQSYYGDEFLKTEPDSKKENNSDLLPTYPPSVSITPRVIKQLQGEPDNLTEPNY